jgi:hypothetical protein
MIYEIKLPEKSVVVCLYLGTYKLRITDSNSVEVSVPISNTEWVVAQFPPWDLLDEYLQEVIRNRKTLLRYED